MGGINSMIKQKFCKNLFQGISFFAVIMIFVILLVFGFISSVDLEANNGWILLVIAISLLLLYFAFGFYWIFQMVIINEKGIQIVLFNKIISYYTWQEIESIEETSIMKNPALRIKITNGSEIHLDKRKKIILAIEYYNK